MRLDSFRNLSKSNIKIDWIIEDLISPGGWTFLVGETKVGKSILMIQLCEALQEGKEFLGLKTKKHNCLYVQADAGLIEWKTQIERVAGESFAWTAHQLERGFLDIEGERKLLHDIVWGSYSEASKIYPVLKGEPFTFVVFDCLHAITHGDINTKSTVDKTLRSIEDIVCVKEIIDGRLQEINRIPFLLVHHPNAIVKRGATAGSGHKGFSDACTTKLVLLNDMLALEGGKLLSKREIPLERDRNTGAWILTDSTLEEEDYSKLLGG